MVVCTPTKIARVIQMRDQGDTFDEIADQLLILKSAACRNYHKYKGTDNYHYREPKPGRPRKLSDHHCRLAVRKIRGGQARDASDLQRQEFPDLSACTVSRALTQRGLPARRRRKKFFLNAKHIGKHRLWASNHEKWSMKKWKCIVFSDESKFNLFGSDGLQWCRRGPGEEFKGWNLDTWVKHGGGHVMVWGCITSHGFGRLHQVEGKMNRFQYVEILEEALLGTLCDHGLSPNDIIFQQDNDPKHTSHHARDWLKTHMPKILDWPPNSPDMSIIEHCWHYLELQIRKHRPLPRTLDQLWDALQVEWAKLGDAYRDKLYEGMPRRIEALVAAKGRHTKY